MKKRLFFLFLAGALLLASCSSSKSSSKGCGGDVCHIGDIVLVTHSK